MYFADETTTYLTLLPGQPVQCITPKTSWTATIPKARLEALADWLEHLWEEGSVFTLAEADLTFTLTHREHIGEGYVEIRHGAEVLGTVYEQLGLSNTHRATVLRAEVAAANMP